MKIVAEIIKSKKLSGFRGVPGNKGGYWVQKLEDSFRDYFNVKHAVAMNSATACLHSACVACGQGEFIVPPLTFSASASCVLQGGSKVRFADIDETTFCIDTGRVISRISEDTKAIIAVDLCGHPAPFNTLRAVAHNSKLKIIEDASQAIGATYLNQKAGKRPR